MMEKIGKVVEKEKFRERQALVPMIDELEEDNAALQKDRECLTAEVDRLRKALGKIEHKTTSCRIWAGMEWHYHHPAVKNIVDIVRAALKEG